LVLVPVRRSRHCFLQPQDAFEHRRSLLAEWAVLDLASLYDYLEQTEITPDLEASLPHNALANDPARLLPLSERTPGTYGLVLADLVSRARQFSGTVR
jgi:hypothetical protein